MDWVAVAAGVLVALAAIQLYREWSSIESRERWGNVLLIVGLSVAVVAPAVVDTLGVDPILGTGLRLVGFLFVLGAAYAILL